MMCLSLNNAWMFFDAETLKKIREVVSESLRLSFLAYKDYMNRQKAKQMIETMIGWVKEHFKVIPELVNDLSKHSHSGITIWMVPLNQHFKLCNYFVIKIK